MKQTILATALAQKEQRNAFLYAATELRKTFHDKRFSYMETSRNPEETVGGLREKEKESLTISKADVFHVILYKYRRFSIC